MTWALLLTLAAVVFFTRSVFLEPKVAIRLPKLLERMLHYAAPCLLAAICVPIMFTMTRARGAAWRKMPMCMQAWCAACWRGLPAAYCSAWL